MMDNQSQRLLRIVAAIALGLPTLLWAEPHWKVRMDPALALANFPNLEVDRAVGDTLSLGLVLWHNNSDNRFEQARTSTGVRMDWFEDSVFSSGWHSNLILKTDWNETELDRLRLKGTQTYQWAWGRFFLNAGIGVQLVTGSLADEGSYYDYESWLLPAWELSIGRSF